MWPLKSKKQKDDEAFSSEPAPTAETLDAKARRFAPGEYPRMVYKHELHTRVVADPVEFRQAQQEGWSEKA